MRGSVLPKVAVEMVISGIIGVFAYGISDGGFWGCKPDETDDGELLSSPCSIYIGPGNAHHGHAVLGMDEGAPNSGGVRRRP